MWTGVFASIAVLAGLLMRGGWNRKARAQRDLPEPAAIPKGFTGEGFAVRYVASNFFGDWLARVVRYDLGVPGWAVLEARAEGVAVHRQSARSFFIPIADLLGSHSDRAVAGRAYERDGIVLLHWRLGDFEIETGVRPRNTADHIELLKLLDGKLS